MHTVYGLTSHKYIKATLTFKFVLEARRMQLRFRFINSHNSL